MMKHIYVDTGAIEPIIRGADLKAAGVNKVDENISVNDICCIAGNETEEFIIM